MNDEWANDLPPHAREILRSAERDEPNAATLERMRVKVAALSAAALAAEAASAGTASAAAAGAGASAGAVGAAGAVAGKSALVIAQSGVFKIVTLVGLLATGAVVTRTASTPPVSPEVTREEPPAATARTIGESTDAQEPSSMTRVGMEPVVEAQVESPTVHVSMDEVEASGAPSSTPPPSRRVRPRSRPGVYVEAESGAVTEAPPEQVQPSPAPLGEELALLSRIRRASPEATLRLCRQHRAEFGDARGFAAERDLYEVEALAARGDEESLRRAAARFLSAHRGSPYAGRVRAAARSTAD